jgi:hypothetical protein
MSVIRNALLANVTTNVATTSIGVSTELPWSQGDTPLYDKNMKKFYLSEESSATTQLFATIDRNDVFQKETSLTGFLTVDAKNQPSDIDTVVAAVINSRLTIADQSVNECAVTTETEDDRITYTFEYRFVTITN